MSSQLTLGAHHFRSVLFTSTRKAGIVMLMTRNQTNLTDLPHDVSRLQQTAQHLGQCYRGGYAFDFQQQLVDLGTSWEEAAVYWDHLDLGWGQQLPIDQVKSNTELSHSLGILLRAPFPRNGLLYYLVKQYLPYLVRLRQTASNGQQLDVRKLVMTLNKQSLPVYKIFRGEF
jgi:hypothetical protein